MYVWKKRLEETKSDQVWLLDYEKILKYAAPL